MIIKMLFTIASPTRIIWASCEEQFSIVLTHHAGNFKWYSQ